MSSPNQKNIYISHSFKSPQKKKLILDSKEKKNFFKNCPKCRA